MTKNQAALHLALVGRRAAFSCERRHPEETTLYQVVRVSARN